MSETQSPGPLYEVAFDVDPEIVAEFDAWLDQHCGEMLEWPGVTRAEVFEEHADDDGRVSRVLQIDFPDDAELERYVTEQAATDRQAAVDHFGGRFAVRSRVMRRSGVIDHRQKAIESCLNCGATLRGQYCGDCGQRAASRLISIWELLRDAFGDLFELDSRLWRTLIPLMTRPGQLTRDYLRGRRARYMPPFRSYLVLSIVFFLIAFFDPRDELGFLFVPEAPQAEQQAADATDGAGDEPAGGAGAAAQDTGTENKGPTIGIAVDDGIETECELDGLEDEDMPAWLASRLTVERLEAACDRIVADDGSAFVKKLLDNVPVALFILLPVMALILKALYPLSKRFYVEHLLFVVHYHAFVFLILSLQVLVTRLGALAPLPELPFDVVGLALTLYVPVYLYKAQRRVYEQGRFYTLVKFSILTIAYFAGLLVMLGLVAIIAAFSI